MAEAPREVHWLAWAAVASGVLGLVLTFSGVDPWPYVGAALICLAPILAICAFVRSRRFTTGLVVVLALVPLGLLILMMYMIATQVS